MRKSTRTTVGRATVGAAGCLGIDPSPSGVSLSPGYMEDWDPCTECVEQNKCPRCGGPLTGKRNEPDTLYCRKCRWNSDEKFEGIPERPECDCYYAQVEESLWD